MSGRIITAENTNKKITLTIALTSICAVALLLLSSCASVSAETNIRIAGKTKTLRAMGRIYMAYGQYPKARNLLTAAMEKARLSDADEGEMAMCLIDMGTLNSYEERYDQAEKFCAAGLELQQKAIGLDHPYTAYTMRLISSILIKKNEYERAGEYLDRAFDVMLQYHKPDDREMATFNLERAKLFTASDKLAQAEEIYTEALDVIELTYGPEHLFTSMVMDGMAELFVLEEKYDQAQTLLDRAITIKQKVYGPDHRLIVPTLLLKARICLATGDFDQTETLFAQAFEAARNTNDITFLASVNEKVSQIRLTARADSENVARLFN